MNLEKKLKNKELKVCSRREYQKVFIKNLKKDMKRCKLLLNRPIIIEICGVCTI